MAKYRWGTVSQRAAKGAEPVMLTTWCDTVLARSHAFLPKVGAVADHQSRNELTTISIRGREGTGKTTVARLLAHALHTELAERARSTKPCASDYEKMHREALRRGYVVRFLRAEDLPHFEELIARMPQVNRILVFDDTSFMGSSVSKEVLAIKAQVTKVRHIGGQDVKTVLIFNFHYSKGLDPYLRDTHFVVQTGITGPEKKNMAELYDVKPGNMYLINLYMKYTRELNKNGQTTVQLGNARARRNHTSRAVTYKYSNPFRLATWFDGEQLSLMVYPGADMSGRGADPLNVRNCAICRPRRAKPSEGEDDAEACAATNVEHIDAGKIVKWLQRQWAAPDMVGRLLRSVFIRKYGYEPMHREHNSGLEMLARLEANGITTFEELVTAYYGPDNARAQRLLTERTRRPRIPDAQRAYFCEALGVDGLRLPGTAPLDPSALAKRAAAIDLPKGEQEPVAPDDQASATETTAPTPAVQPPSEPKEAKPE